MKQTLFSLASLLAAFALIALLSGCINTERADERASEIKEAHSWYCGPGLFGIRAVARFTIAMFTGTRLPDVCKAIGVIVVEAE